VVIVDDHPVVRLGVRMAFQEAGEATVVAEAGDLTAARRLVAEARPDLLLLDLVVGDQGGPEAIRDFLVIAPSLKILVLSVHEETVYAERVLRAGARGYLMKRDGLDELAEAVRTVMAGDVYVSRAMAGQLLSTLVSGRATAPDEFTARLSDRELTVFRLLGSGRTTGEIAEALHLSPKTVGTYRENIKAKLGLTSAGELLCAARDHATRTRR
jgi:DNA-binding NarL/FixJ family response regulator